MKELNKMIRLAGILILIFPLANCGGGKEQSKNQESEPMDHRTAVRLKQYTIQGKQLYQTYCMNCHQEDGKGLAQLYPPLAGSDYLLADLPRAACIIKNGSMEEITVNGVKYNQMMPANPTLTPLEIAEILTYITNSWGNEKGLTPVKEVEKWIAACEEK